MIYDEVAGDGFRDELDGELFRAHKVAWRVTGVTTLPALGDDGELHLYLAVDGHEVQPSTARYKCKRARIIKYKHVCVALVINSPQKLNRFKLKG